MTITNKYEFETTNYGTTGWNALLATSLEKADTYIHTYYRYMVASGEEISAYDPVICVSGEWKKAQADGSLQPAHGIAIEAKVSGEYLRAQRIGPLTNTSWSFTGSGEVYLSATGTLTQNRPASSKVQILGYSIASDKILIYPSQSSFEGLDVTTTLSNPGVDTNIPTEKAVSSALNHDPSALSDHGYTCHTAKMNLSGESFSFGSILFNKSGELSRATAASASSVPALFMATGTASGERNVMVPPGFVRDDSWSWTLGSILYVSATSGELTATKPSSSGQQVQIVGHAIAANKIYFNPNSIVVEVS